MSCYPITQKNKRNGGDLLKQFKNVLLTVLADVFIVNFSVFVTLLIRLVEPMTEITFKEHLMQYVRSLCVAIPMLTIILCSVFYFFGIYRILWRFARVSDAYKLSGATAITFVTFMAFHMLFFEIFGHCFGIKLFGYLSGSVCKKKPRQ